MRRNGHAKRGIEHETESPLQAPGIRTTTGNVPHGIGLVHAMRQAGDDRQIRAKQQHGGQWQLPPDLLALLQAEPPTITVTARPEPPLRPALGNVTPHGDEVPPPLRTEAPLPPVRDALDVSRLPAAVLGAPVIPAGFNACIRVRSEPPTEAKPTGMETD